MVVRNIIREEARRFKAGVYKLKHDLPCPYIKAGLWPEGTKFVIEKHIEKIGEQDVYEYFSLRLSGVNKHLLRSYQAETWNAFTSHLR